MRLSSFILAYFMFIFIACERDFSGITIYDHLPITSHDYEWEIDTLLAPDAFQVLMYDIWGTDENNVYVTGHSDTYPYQLWHWDGVSWHNIPLRFPGHPHSFQAIHGFSENDIWIVGEEILNYPNIIHKDFIVHYDGTQWRYIKNLDEPMCLSVWGSNSSNLFVGCDSGIVLHYDGNKWIKQDTGTRARIHSIQGFSSSKVFAAGVIGDNSPPLDSTFYYFFEYDGHRWKLADSYIDYLFSPPGYFGHRLWASPDGELYGGGNDGLFLRRNGNWIRLKEDYLIGISGTGKNNIFITGPHNVIKHYNGQDWFQYQEFIDYSKWAGAIWCNKNNVFIIGRANNRSFIYRGKLKF